MKQFIVVATSFLLVSWAFIGCNDSESSSSQVPEVEKPDSEAVITNYSLDTGSIKVKWTGYKLENKTGVEGLFDVFSIANYTNNASSLSELVMGSELIIDASSTKTGDESRDKKIKQSFFGSMLDASVIKGVVTLFDGKNEGSAIIALSLNGITKDHVFDWKLQDDMLLVLKSSINVPDWNAQSSLDSLNVVCEDKHRGDGAESITWPDVDIIITARITTESQAIEV